MDSNAMTCCCDGRNLCGSLFGSDTLSLSVSSSSTPSTLDVDTRADGPKFASPVLQQDVRLLSAILSTSRRLDDIEPSPTVWQA